MHRIYFQAHVHCEEDWKKTLSSWGKQRMNFHDIIFIIMLVLVVGDTITLKKESQIIAFRKFASVIYFTYYLKKHQGPQKK